jgi:imidazole glycerol-phosphate synthase subunit HisH
MSVAIIDYGVGNLNSLVRAAQRLGAEVALADSPQKIAAADHLILPGVGHFDECVNGFQASGLRSAVEEAVFGKGKPVLGVCVGYQMMARRSEEGTAPGLGWLAADVRRFSENSDGVQQRVPHVGWNSLINSRGVLFEDLGTEPRFYFTHSYYVVLDDPAVATGICHYGVDFAAAAQNNSMHGVQFHPEKSHDAGLNVIRNFLGSC